MARRPSATVPAFYWGCVAVILALAVVEFLLVRSSGSMSWMTVIVAAVVTALTLVICVSRWLPFWTIIPPITMFLLSVPAAFLGYVIYMFNAGSTYGLDQLPGSKSSEATALKIESAFGIRPPTSMTDAHWFCRSSHNTREDNLIFTLPVADIPAFAKTLTAVPEELPRLLDPLPNMKPWWHFDQGPWLVARPQENRIWVLSTSSGRVHAQLATSRSFPPRKP